MGRCLEGSGLRAGGSWGLLAAFTLTCHPARHFPRGSHFPSVPRPQPPRGKEAPVRGGRGGQGGQKPLYGLQPRPRAVLLAFPEFWLQEFPPKRPLKARFRDQTSMQHLNRG